MFAVCVGVGIGGLPPGGRVRIAAAFATAEVAMNLIGAGAGVAVGHVLGDVAGYLGFAALVGVGLYMLIETARESERRFDLSRGWGLFLAALSISLDSLGVGFSIVYIGVPLPLTLAAIALASVAATSLGLVFGRMLGASVERAAGYLGGAALMLTGILFAVLRYLHVG